MAVSFDVREFARSAIGSHRDRLDLTRYDLQPLASETLRCLRYLRDLERATMRYLREVLVTPTHKDARITAFLTTWAYEKYWIADAVEAILERHDDLPAPAERPRPRWGIWVGGGGREGHWATAWRRMRHRLAPIQRSLVDNTLGEDVVAVHMATGSIEERLADAAYERVAELAGHPELTRTVATIRDIKSRHLTFFDAEAQERLRRSRLARYLTRTRLRRSGWPAARDDRSRGEQAFFLRRVFGSAPALVEELDRRVQALPGLERLALIRAAVAASG